MAKRRMRIPMLPMGSPTYTPGGVIAPMPNLNAMYQMGIDQMDRERRVSREDELWGRQRDMWRRADSEHAYKVGRRKVTDARQDQQYQFGLDDRADTKAWTKESRGQQRKTWANTNAMLPVQNAAAVLQLLRGQQQMDQSAQLFPYQLQGAELTNQINSGNLERSQDRFRMDTELHPLRRMQYQLKIAQDIKQMMGQAGISPQLAMKALGASQNQLGMRKNEMGDPIPWDWPQVAEGARNYLDVYNGLLGSGAVQTESAADKLLKLKPVFEEILRSK